MSWIERQERRTEMARTIDMPFDFGQFCMALKKVKFRNRDRLHEKDFKENVQKLQSAWKEGNQDGVKSIAAAISENIKLCDVSATIRSKLVEIKAGKEKPMSKLPVRNPHPTTLSTDVPNKTALTGIKQKANETELASTKIQLSDLAKDVNDLHGLIFKTKEKLPPFRSTYHIIEQIRTHISKIKDEVSKRENDLKRLKGTVQSLEKWNIAQKDDILSINGDKDDDAREDVYAKTEREIKFLRKELRIKEQALEISMVERDQLLNRLCEVTSSKMKINNPNNTDINDFDRSTRIAEKFSDLYDSEWTDSLHILTLESRFDEISAIRLLLDILLDSYSFCERTSERHIQLLMEDLFYPCKGGGEMRAVEASKFNMVPKKLLTDMQRAVSPGSVTHVQAQFRESVRQSRKHVQDDRLFQRLKKYMDKCTELCWQMVVQSPPMHMDTEVHKSGDNFDRDAYRFYTKSGSKVDYIVWPAVYLSRKGIVLQKGVAQAKAEGVALRITSLQTLRNM